MVIAEINDQTGPDAAEELEGTFVHTGVTDPAATRLGKATGIGFQVVCPLRIGRSLYLPLSGGTS